MSLKSTILYYGHQSRQALETAVSLWLHCFNTQLHPAAASSKARCDFIHEKATLNNMKYEP